MSDTFNTDHCIPPDPLIYGYQRECPACGSAVGCDLFPGDGRNVTVVACQSCPAESDACTDETPAYPAHTPYIQTYRLRLTWPMWRLRRAGELRKEFPAHTWESAFAVVEQGEDQWWRGAAAVLNAMESHDIEGMVSGAWLSATRRWQRRRWEWLMATCPGLHWALRKREALHAR